MGRVWQSWRQCQDFLGRALSGWRGRGEGSEPCRVSRSATIPLASDASRAVVRIGFVANTITMVRRLCYSAEVAAEETERATVADAGRSTAAELSVEETGSATIGDTR